MSTREASSENISTDTAALRALLESAAAVELFTIPLYMTTLYSLQGTYASGTTDGAADLWPGLNPAKAVQDHETTAERNQGAFNAIFSVFIQEMLHLQLAANLLNAVGGTVKFTGDSAPSFAGGNSIPCVGQFEGINVALGELDANTIQMFLDIETPNWKAEGQHKDIPSVPLEGWSAGDPLPVFGTIGHLYTVISEYIKLSYADGSKLWDKVYEPSKHQVVVFAKASYPGMPVKLDATVGNTQQQALLMCAAITDQGEGGDKGTDKWLVPEADQPAKDAVSASQEKWDEESHYKRFEDVKALMAEGVETFSAYFAAREAAGEPHWKWSDLTGSTDENSAAGKFAAARAAVLNGDVGPTQGKTPVELLTEALNQSYSNLLFAMERAWTAGTDFPYNAMSALNTRVTSLWAAGGQPTVDGEQKWFLYTQGESIPEDKGHACQGLDPNNPGQNLCASFEAGSGATIHTCASSNDCKNQGGCGYPGKPKVENTDVGPDFNSDKGNGGCGAPIPVAQVFGQDYSGKLQIESDAGTSTVSYAGGDKVYETAWAVFKARFPGKVEADAKPPAPNPLRLVLPPS